MQIEFILQLFAILNVLIFRLAVLKNEGVEEFCLGRIRNVPAKMKESSFARFGTTNRNILCPTLFQFYHRRFFLRRNTHSGRIVGPLR